MDIRELEQIIDRYLSGTATAEETAFVQRWIEQGEQDPIRLDEERRESIRLQLWAAIGGATARDKTPVVVRRMPWRRQMLRYAAALLVLSAGCVAYYYYKGRHHSGDIRYVYITAPPGQQRTYLLPDSSLVYLFPHSTLGVPSNYNGDDRRITISGRGFFDVRHDPGRPFSVQAGQLNTRVLGTSFEVASKDSLPASVIVRTGRVGVEYGNRLLAILAKDERLRYDRDRQDYTRDTVDAAALCEWWKTGIAFQQTPLREVVRTMSDWYNVPIRISNKRWLAESVTIRFNGQPLDSAMLLLSNTLGFEYNKQAHEIVIY